MAGKQYFHTSRDLFLVLNRGVAVPRAHKIKQNNLAILNTTQKFGVVHPYRTKNLRPTAIALPEGTV